jgi:SAM-dependent methyltransferase
VGGQGFERSALKARYDVAFIEEDPWHAHTGRRTADIVIPALQQTSATCRYLLNAGCGCHGLQPSGWQEVAVDLFATPLKRHRISVCASVENLPFGSNSFGAVVCVGEVLAYCDPARAITEFARVLVPAGTLICDFGSSRSFKYRFSESFGRAADLVIDRYNGSAEKIWVYDPRYIRSLLEGSGLAISAEVGIHFWSALARRAGLSPSCSVAAERWLSRIAIAPAAADVMTFVAQRRSA